MEEKDGALSVKPWYGIIVKNDVKTREIHIQYYDDNNNIADLFRIHIWTSIKHVDAKDYDDIEDDIDEVMVLSKIFKKVMAKAKVKLIKWTIKIQNHKK